MRSEDTLDRAMRAVGMATICLAFWAMSITLIFFLLKGMGYTMDTPFLYFLAGCAWTHAYEDGRKEWRR